MAATKVKIFKGVENEIAELEAEVNAWLAGFGGRVVNVVGNLAPQSVDMSSNGAGLSKSSFPPSDILLVFVYEV